MRAVYICSMPPVYSSSLQFVLYFLFDFQGMGCGARTETPQIPVSLIFTYFNFFPIRFLCFSYYFIQF